MSDNPMMGARLTLDLDKTASDNTAKVLQDIYDKTKKLSAANNEAAGAANNAAGGANKLQKELAAIGKAAQFDKLAKDFGTLAGNTGNTAKAVAELNAKLKALGASEAEIKKIAKAFQNASDQAKKLKDNAGNVDDVRDDLTGGADEPARRGNGPGGNRFQKAGAAIRNLPSIQIPGLGIGTDAIGNILRVSGALGDAAGKAAFLTSATNLLTPALGATAATAVAAAGAAALILAPLAAIALAIKAVGDEAAKQAAVMDGIIDSRRKTNEILQSGAGTEEIQKQIDALNVKRKDEANLLDNTLRPAYASFEQQTGALGGVLKAVDAREESLNSQIDKSTTSIADYDAQISQLTAALGDGRTAANDAAAAELKLAEERTKAVLQSAAAAGQEVQTRARADKATFEQNESRLQAIADESAAIQAQLAVLQNSGDTSEEVTAQIAALTGQLGALGKESAYISTTALAASKARDAEKKAIKDAEKAREEALRTLEQADKKRLAAGQKYSETLIDIATKAADAAEDALRGLEDKLAANELSFGRDIDKLSRDANNDRLENEIKVQAEEAADLREHQRKLESIRDDALANEDDALKKRDFLSAARIREATNQKIEAENRAFQDGQTEKQIADEDARRKEDRELDNARQERLRQLQQQNDDARLAYDMRLRDDAIAQERQQRDAGINRDRELAAAQELADSVLHIKGLQAAAELQLAGSVLAGIQAMAGGFQAPQMAFNGQGGGNNSTFNSSRTIGSLSIPITQANNPGAIAQQMLQILGGLGLMPN